MTHATRANAWETLGQNFPTALTDINAVRAAARLDWEPVEEPQYRRVLTGMDAQGEPVYDFQQVPGFKYVLRSDDPATILDSANATYQLFGHGEMMAIADAIMGIYRGRAGDGLEFVAGGPIYNGRKVWLCAKLGREVFLPGDASPYVKHLVLSNAHDGTGSLKVLPVAERISCRNALHRAEMDAKARMAAFTFRHTPGIDRRVQAAKTALEATMGQLDKIEETAADMLTVKLSTAARTEILHEHAVRLVLRRDLKDIKTRADIAASPVAMSAVNATVDELVMLLGSPTCQGIDGTAWGVYQAIVEHADHIRPTLSADRYLARTILDRSPDKLTGFQIIQELHRR